MKTETIEKGKQLLAGIKTVQDTKDVLNAIAYIELCNDNGRTVGKLRLNTDVCFLESHPHPDLLAKIKEEFIRFLQRAKRHCDEHEHKLKEELEDLAE
jgi:hypothetical protein